MAVSSRVDAALDTLIRYFEREYPHLTRGARWPTRKGDYFVPCPYHGERNADSFSFSERGFKCFACGEKGGLFALARHLGVEADSGATARDKAPARPQPSVLSSRDAGAPFWASWGVAEFEAAFWPLTPPMRAYMHGREYDDATLDAFHLRYGTLPRSRCHHPRIILPCFRDDKLVAIRGRWFECPCDSKKEKWLCSSGSQTVLYGADHVKIGAPLVIVEAPFSVILGARCRPDVSFVAGTSGAGCWREEWSAYLVSTAPSTITIWLDNDAAGRKNAPKVAESLARHGRRAHIKVWPGGPAESCDVGDALVAEIRSRAAG